MLFKSKEHIIIFSSKLTPLGELICNKGMYEKVMLNQAGEEELGDLFTDWHIKGMPALVPEVSTTKKTNLIVAEQIQLRSPLFKTAFLAWLDLRDYQYLIFTDSVIKVWHLLDQLPLRAQEKYLLSSGIRNLKQKEIKAWISSLQKIHQNILQ